MDPLHTAALGPCERCGAEQWQVQRPGLWSGTTDWLRSGGPWRRPRAVCGGCGSPGPSTGWLVRWDDAPRSRVTLPGRVVRALLRTVAQERTAVPAPWLPLASAAVGSAVGIGAAVVTRSGRPVSAGTAGACSGALVCWSVFASTAFRRPSTWFELRTAALQEVSPARAAGLRAARESASARTAAFPVYGLEGWQGPRVLAGHSSHGSPPQVSSVVLGHGVLSGDDGPWALVETADLSLGHAEHDDASLADALWDQTAVPAPPDLATSTDAELLAHLSAVRAARAARTDPEWHLGTLRVDGRPTPARWAADGQHWVARVPLDGLSVSVRAHAVPLEAVSLVAVEDLEAWLPWSVGPAPPPPPQRW